MRLRELRIRSWRNLARATLRPGESTTVLYGQNGQGKTNFLEAAYAALCFRSFRTTSLSEAIAWDASETTVEAEITVRGIDRSLSFQIAREGKRAQLDGKTVRRDSSALMGVGAVFFGPDDLRLAKTTASERRRFMDRAVFGAFRPYSREAQAFERILKSRNMLLRRGVTDNTLMTTYDERLAEAGARIVIRRRALVNSLRTLMVRAFHQLHSGVPVDIHYRSDPLVEMAQSEGEIAAALREALRDHRKTDERRGFTGVGPQTDDLELLLNGRLAREHASQGQLRSMVLALKVAELQHLRKELDEPPLLLLDDVASELDEERREKLFEVMASLECQSLVTVTEREHLAPLVGCVDYEVRQGALRLV